MMLSYNYHTLLYGTVRKIRLCQREREIRKHTGGAAVELKLRKSVFK